MIGFGRLGTVIRLASSANQPMFLAGSLDVDASDKAARFIRFCDAFNIPVITLMDVPGFFPWKGARGERHHPPRRENALRLRARRRCPKSRSCYAKAMAAPSRRLCTREMGADQLFVWPGVELAVMGGGGAVNVLYKREIEQSPDPAKTRAEKIAEYQERFNGPFEALAKQFASRGDPPRTETRKRLIHNP